MKLDEKIKDRNVFDVDSMLSNDKTMGENVYYIQRSMMSKIDKIKKDTQLTKLITNGNIASVLQDMAGYSLTPNNIKLENTTNPFPLGKLGDIDMFVDSNMRWSDNTIIFFKDENEVYTLIIKDTRNVLI